MKNVYSFWFESDDLKNNFKLLCSNNSVSIQERITALIKADIEREPFREKLKQEYLSNKISQDEYAEALKVLNGMLTSN